MHSCSFLGHALLAVCAAAASTTLAQAQPAASPSDDLQKLYEDMIRTPIVAPRDPDAVGADITRVKLTLQQSGRVIGDAEARVREAEGWISSQKREIDAVKRQSDTAKKEKREPDRLKLEAQRKQLELVADYLKKTKDVRDSEVGLAKAQKELMEAELKSFDSELLLNKEAERLARAKADDPDLVRQALDAAKASEATVKALKEVSDRQTDIAKRTAQIADRRVDLVQVRNRLLSEDRIRAIVAHQIPQ